MGLIDDDVTATRERDHGEKRVVDLLLHPLPLEQVSGTRVMDEAVDEGGRHPFRERPHPLEGLPIVDGDALDGAELAVAKHLEDRGHLGHQAGWGPGAILALDDLVPRRAETVQVPCQVVGAGVDGGAAHDDASVVGEQRLDHVLEPLAQAALGDAACVGDAGALGLQDQVASGERDPGGELDPLSRQGVAGHLDQRFHPLLDVVRDAIPRLRVLPVRGAGLGQRQEPGPLEADVDEGRLQPAMHALHPSQVDVADNARPARAPDLERGKALRVHQSDAHLEGLGADQDPVDGPRLVTPPIAAGSRGPRAAPPSRTRAGQRRWYRTR